MASIDPEPSPEHASIAGKPPLLSNSNENTMAHDGTIPARLIPPSSNFRGATLADCEAALESSSQAFKSWSKTSPLERRRLLQDLTQVCRLVTLFKGVYLSSAAHSCP
jgi:acyl-CoA reductase-like NAD-dependent aldehyde dehydrogenase